MRLQWDFAALAAMPALFAAWTLVLHVFDGFDPSVVRGLRVVVCGASTGIGEELVYQYARGGAHVAAVARGEAALQRVAAAGRRLGAASVTPIAADVSTLAGATAAVEAAFEAPGFEGGLDALVLNHVTGYWGWLLPENLTSAAAGELGGVAAHIDGGFGKLEAILRVNALSYMHLAALAAPALARSGAGAWRRGGGQLVVVSSAAGKMGLPKVAPYSASKHALHGFFDSLRLEIVAKDLPVSVTLCVLGNIDTEANRKNTAGDLTRAPKRVPADQTAMAIVRAGATRQRELYYPWSQGLQVMAWLRPLMPSLLDRVALFMAM